MYSSSQDLLEALNDEVFRPPPPLLVLRPSPRTNRTRRVPHPVLIGHAVSHEVFRIQVDTMRSARRAGSVSLVIETCSCNGAPVPINQVSCSVQAT